MSLGRFHVEYSDCALCIGPIFGVMCRGSVKAAEETPKVFDERKKRRGGGGGGYLVYYSVTAGLRRPMKTLVRLF